MLILLNEKSEGSLLVRIFLILLWIPTGLLAQERRNIGFSHLTVNDGLSQSAVLSIFRDSFGFMWFGTNDGLNRYDGFEFIVFRNHPEESGYLLSSQATALAEDNHQVLWVGSSVGISLLDLKTHKVIQTFSMENTPVFKHNKVRHIAKTRNGDMWVSTENGIYQFQEATKDWKPWFFNEHVPKNGHHSNAFMTSEDADGIIWVATYQGLFRITPTTGDIRVFTISTKNEAEPNKFKSVDASQKPYVWITHEHSGVYRLNTLRGKIEKFTEIETQPLADITLPFQVKVDMMGRVWIGSWGYGIYVYDPSSGEIKNYSEHDRGLSSIIYSSIETIYHDPTGITWIGTYGNGISKYAPSANKFVTYNDSQTGFRSVRKIFKDEKGNVWVGGYGGIRIFPGKLDYKKETAAIEHWLMQHPYIRYIVYDIYQDPKLKDIMWFATEGYGLFRVNIKKREIIPLTEANSDLPSNYIYTLNSDPDGNMWAGTYGGIWKISVPKEKNPIIYRHQPTQSNSISHSEVRVMLWDRDKTLWVGTVSGLNKIQPNGIIKQYFHDKRNIQSIGGQNIRSIVRDTIGNLWIGSIDGGLSRFNEKTETFFNRNKEHGLSNKTVYGVLVDQDNDLWISTNNGISRYNQDKDNFTVYNYRDGIPINEFNSNAYFKSSDGELFFGSVDGWLSFYPDQITNNKQPPQVALTQVYLNNNKQFPEMPASFIKELNVYPEDQLISLHVAVLDFSQPARNKLYYRLVGFQNEWRQQMIGQPIVFTSLPPKTYQLIVQAENNDQVRNNSVQLLTIVVHPPFYKTLTFYFLLIILIGLVIFYWIKSYYKNIQERNLELLNLVAERTLELSEKNKQLEYTLVELHEVISNLNRTELQLIQSEKLATVGQLSAGLSHELNNPLNFITASVGPLKIYVNELTHLLKVVTQLEEHKFEHFPELKKFITHSKFISGESAEKEIEKLMQSIEFGANRAAEIVKNLRMFSENPSDEKVSYDVHEGLLVVLKILKNIHNYQVSVVTDFQTKKSISCYPNLLNHMFLNVIQNSLQAVDKNGKIMIKTWDEDNKLHIQISDNGKGISPQSLKRVFEPFFTTREVGKHKGLGLALSYNIAQQHKGTITISSEINKGTTVNITLPISTEE